MGSPTSEPLPFLSRLLCRILDHRKKWDLFWAALIGAWPIPVAAILGTGKTSQGYRGYFEAYNFLAFVVILPASLWLLRWVMNRMAPVSPATLPKEPPPLIELLHTEEGKRVVYQKMRRWMLSPWLLIVTLSVVLVIHIVDMKAMIWDLYIMEKPETVEKIEKDWGTFFLQNHGRIPGENENEEDTEVGVSKAANLLFVFSAYSVQFLTLLIAFLLGFLTIVHNCFFLRNIYQRRWVPDGEEEFFFQIDLDDQDQCFGFRNANNAFNTQVIFLMLGGVAMLVTRFFHAPSWADLRKDPDHFIPDIGQAMIAFGWLFAFFVVCLPALVKLLPRLPIRSNERASRNITNYLREFLTPEQWPFGREPSSREITSLAARFRSNSFWPTGNNRASQLFFFAIWVGLLVFFTPPIDDNYLFLYGAITLMGILAYLGRNVLFGLMNSSLRYIDHRLVDPPEGDLLPLNLPGRKLKAGVFLSYRRKDSPAYTGRLYDYLVDHFYKDQIFVDVESIPGGDEFSVVLNDALEASAAVIVVIGPRWLSAEDSSGNRRLDSENDWVRMEVSSSLKRPNVKIFPVLVGGAELPLAEELPPDMADLVGRNARELSDTRWDYDTKKLMADIRAALDENRRSDS